MGSSLRLIREEETLYVPTTLLVAAPGARRITVEERNVPMPLISLLLHGSYELGELIDVEGYGTQMTATLPYIWQGRRVTMTGIVLPLLGGPLLAVPFGFLGRRH